MLHVIVFMFIPIMLYSQMWKEKDKHYHYGAGVISSALTYDYVYRKTNNRKKAFIYSVGSAVLVGTIKELLDHNQKGNRFDSRDLLATTYGGLTISLTFNLFKNKKRHKQK